MANSGIVIVTELRKLVDGVQTTDTKPNLKGDKDYIPPYQDFSKCVQNADPVTPAPTPAPTVAPTPVFSYNPFGLSDSSYTNKPAACLHSGGYVTAYHNGSKSTPEVGDEVYVDSLGATAYSDGTYKLNNLSETIDVSSGLVTLRATCTVPTPIPVPTPAPVTPAPTTPAPTPAPVAVADYSCGDGWTLEATSDYSYGSYPSVSVSSTDGTSNNFYWEALDRPNRFNVYEAGSLVATSGWVGQASYSGPWGMSLNTVTSGNFSFQWTSGSTTREVRVEYGAADPNYQIGDGARWQIQCGTSPAPTPTPAPTTAPTGLSVTIYTSNGSWAYNTGGDSFYGNACSAATSGTYGYSVLMYKASGNTNYYPEAGDTFEYNGNTVINGAYYGWSGSGPNGTDVYYFGLNGSGAVSTTLTLCP